MKSTKSSRAPMFGENAGVVAVIVIALIAFFVAIEKSHGMALIRKVQEAIEKQGAEEAEGNQGTPTNAPPPPVVTNTPAPAADTTEAAVWSRAKYERIAKDVKDWKITATITKARFSGQLLFTSGNFPEWPCKDGLQGCFALAVEQPDGSVIVGTFDWDRCPHQGSKTIDNLTHGAEHKFFNLRSGARVWVFVTAFSRDNKRTVKERSNLYELRWP